MIDGPGVLQPNRRNRPRLSVTFFTTAQVEVSEYHPSRSAWVRSHHEMADGLTVEVGNLAWAEGDIANRLRVLIFLGMRMNRSLDSKWYWVPRWFYRLVAQVGDLPTTWTCRLTRTCLKWLRCWSIGDEPVPLKEGPNQLNGATGLATGQFRWHGAMVSCDRRCDRDCSELEGWPTQLGSQCLRPRAVLTIGRIFFSGTSLPEFKPTLRLDGSGSWASFSSRQWMSPMERPHLM